MRAFGKDRARETQAPARSILASVPTPLGPPVGCHPTPSDGIAHANVERPGHDPRSARPRRERQAQQRVQRRGAGLSEDEDALSGL